MIYKIQTNIQYKQNKKTKRQTILQTKTNKQTNKHLIRSNKNILVNFYYTDPTK